MEKMVAKILDELKDKYSKCPPEITDLVFLEIEKNHLKRYYKLVKIGTKNKLNSNIGKYIKAHWSLNDLDRCYSPKSQLIKSYMRHS